METSKAILSRHAVRLFDANRLIKVADLKKIVHLAQQAPSWVDSQPWRVYIATGETLKKIKQSHRANAEGQVKSDPDWPTTHRADWAAFPQNNMAAHNQATAKFWQNDRLQGITRAELQTRLYDAPAICYLTIPKNANQWSAYDLGSFSQTLMLAAKGMGIDSMPAYEIVRFPHAIRKIMGIPDNEAIAMGIALGYADTQTGVNDYRAPRVALDKVLKIMR